MNKLITLSAILALSLSLSAKEASAPVNTEIKQQQGVVITLNNFIHADSTRAFLKELAASGGKVNKVRPVRIRINTDNQDVIRMNDDTLYTRVILDVKGGATITTKDYEGYQNINVQDLQHSQIASLDGSGTLKLDESMLTEGHHAYIIVRTGLLRELPMEEQMKKAHKAQDNVSITYHSSEPFVPPVKYDYATLDKVKYKIFKNFALHPKKDIAKNGFGTAAGRDLESAQTAIAIGWGAMDGDQAVYSSFTGKKEREVFTIDRPNLHYDKRSFFSITIYNTDGWIATQKYAINSDDMKVNKDGTYTITFLASGEPVQEGDLNVVRTPRGKYWTGVLRAYIPKNGDKTFAWADNWTEQMTKQFMK